MRRKAGVHGLLDLQADDGHWGGGPYVVPGWIATTDTLVVLKDLGLDATSPRVRRAIERVRITNWGPEFEDSPYFDGEEEACINGRVLACGAYFGQPSASLVELLLSEQKEDGGWNCWPRSQAFVVPLDDLRARRVARVRARDRRRCDGARCASART